MVVQDIVCCQKNLDKKQTLFFQKTTKASFRDQLQMYKLQKGYFEHFQVSFVEKKEEFQISTTVERGREGTPTTESEIAME